MAYDHDRTLDALAVSQLGKAFGDRLKVERTRMEDILAERESALARLETTIAAALADAKEKAVVGEETLAALRAERDAAIAAQQEAHQREREALEAAKEFGTERDAAIQELASEATRLTLEHQGQVEALLARHRDSEDQLQAALADAKERAVASEQAIAALRAERDAAIQKLDSEATRLKLVHQGQVEALFARHREAETSLRAALAEAKEQAVASEQAIAALRTERDAAIASQREALEATKELGTQRDAAIQELASEAARLTLEHQEQVDALLARHRDAENSLQHALADAKEKAVASEQAITALQAERDSALRELASEATRLALEHQGQIDSLAARHSEAEAGWQVALTDSGARISELEALRDSNQYELATLREQLRALAQEAAEARFARGEAEIALHVQKERNAALDARLRVTEERGEKHLNDLLQALNLTRVEADARVDEARDAVSRAEQRIAALTRNARAREMMLQESAQEAVLQGQVATLGERARSDRLASQVASLTLVLRKFVHRSDVLDAAFGGLDAEADGRKLATQSVDDAVRWLATLAGPAMARGIDAGFEVAAALRWADPTWIEAAYCWLLGRPADDEGKAHYARKLAGTMTRRDMLIDLACSQEARARLVYAGAVHGAEDRQFVMAAYHSMLNRGADTGGLDHYLAQIDAGMSRGQVLLDLARSAEARDAATPVGTSLLAIWQTNLPRNKWRERVRLRLLRRLPAWRHAWEAGRLAGLQCDIALAQEATDEQLEEIRREIERRVAAAREASIAGAATSSLDMVAAPNFAATPSASEEQSFPYSLPNAILGETSEQRNPNQIVGLIRQELKELGLG